MMLFARCLNDQVDSRDRVSAFSQCHLAHTLAGSPERVAAGIAGGIWLEVVSSQCRDVSYYDSKFCVSLCMSLYHTATHIALHLAAAFCER